MSYKIKNIIRILITITMCVNIILLFFTKYSIEENDKLLRKNKDYIYTIQKDIYLLELEYSYYNNPEYIEYLVSKYLSK